MDAERLTNLLKQVASGATDVQTALKALEQLPFADLGYARLDHHRALRLGIPEVVLADGKATPHLLGIVQRLIDAGDNVLVTRLRPEVAAELQARFPAIKYSELGRTATLEQKPIVNREGASVCVVTAGTSDIPVAEEALETLRMAGIRAEHLFDVGVAGIHRLLASLEQLSKARAIIVIAGMEGALPSVIGGLVGVPVIAVPTSVGYGTALSGFTALCGMLTSCASGITVVNIDNGFGAAMAVLRMFSRNETIGAAK